MAARGLPAEERPLGPVIRPIIIKLSLLGGAEGLSAEGSRPESGEVAGRRQIRSC